MIVVGDRQRDSKQSSTLGQDVSTIDHTYGGARVEHLVPVITAADNRWQSNHSNIPKHRTVIVIIAGICTLTDKIKTAAGTDIVFPPEDRDIRVEAIKKALQDIWSYEKDNDIYNIACSVLPAILIGASCSNKAKGKFHQHAETTLLRPTSATGASVSIGYSDRVHQ